LIDAPALIEISGPARSKSRRSFAATKAIAIDFKNWFDVKNLKSMFHKLAL
jgi:hypothetical protein